MAEIKPSEISELIKNELENLDQKSKFEEITKMIRCFVWKQKSKHCEKVEWIEMNYQQFKTFKLSLKFTIKFIKIMKMERVGI